MTKPYRAGDAGFLEGAADLFESWPWWVLLPMCALFLGIIYTLMIQRGLNKREWTVPSQSQIVLVQGKLDDDRVGVKGPYRLNVGSRIIRLYCEPYIGTWQSCLEAKESYDHLSSRPVQVSYFLAKTDWGAKIAVLMNVSSGGKPVLTFNEQRKWLLDIASQEDGDKAVPPILGFLFFGIAAFVTLYGFAIKLSGTIKSFKRQKARGVAG